MIWTTAIALLGLMALSIPVGIVLFLLGIGVGQFYSAFPLLRGMGQVIWSSSNSSTLIAIPLFVLLGEILVRNPFVSQHVDLCSVGIRSSGISAPDPG